MKSEQIMEKGIKRILIIIFCLGILHAELSAKKGVSIFPVHLRTEYISEPLGLQVPVPFLSWQFNSELRDQKQTAYQVLVASKVETLKSKLPL